VLPDGLPGRLVRLVWTLGFTSAIVDPVVVGAAVAIDIGVFYDCQRRHGTLGRRSRRPHV